MAKERDFEDCFTVAGDLQEFAAIIDKCVEWLREEPLTDKQEAGHDACISLRRTSVCCPASSRKSEGGIPMTDTELRMQLYAIADALEVIREGLRKIDDTYGQRHLLKHIQKDVNSLATGAYKVIPAGGESDG